MLERCSVLQKKKAVMNKKTIHRVQFPFPPSFLPGAKQRVLTIWANSEGLIRIILPGCQEPDNAAVSHEENSFLHEVKKQISDYLSAKTTTFNLPLCIEGTPFQREVWKIFRTVGYGETRSYKDIAILLGSQNKARAIGMAAHCNPLAIIIPCHRIIGSNKKLTGFAGGLSLKKNLLDLEQNCSR